MHMKFFMKINGRQTSHSVGLYRQTFGLYFLSPPSEGVRNSRLIEMYSLFIFSKCEHCEASVYIYVSFIRSWVARSAMTKKKSFEGVAWSNKSLEPLLQALLIALD